MSQDKIFSKDILGCFYVPEFMFSTSETFLIMSTAYSLATAGKSVKTMNLLGRCDSVAVDYFIIHALGLFIKDKETSELKAKIIAVGVLIRASRSSKEVRVSKWRRTSPMNASRSGELSE